VLRAVEFKFVVKGFSLLTHREELKGRIFFDLLVSDIVLLHVDLCALEVLNSLGVFAKLVESFSGFFMGSVVSSVHQDEYFLLSTADSGVPVLTNDFFNVIVRLGLGDGSTLMEGSQLVI
jgi:hypothetical protein